MDFRVCYVGLLTLLFFRQIPARNTSMTWSEYQRMVNISDSLIATHRKSIKPPIQGAIYLDSLTFQFLDLDEPEERLTMIMDTTLMWRYGTISWDSHSKYDQFLTFSDDEVWFPILRLVNINSRNLDSAIRPNMGSIFVTSGGIAAYTATKATETRCSIYATYFPFDEQVCDIIVNVRTISIDDLSFKYLDMKGVFDHINADNIWKFKLFKLGKFLSRDGLNVHLRLFLKRKPAWAVVNIILPIFILVSLSSLVFLLPKDGGERVGLSVTILLTVSVYMTLVSDVLPMSSDPLPIFTIVMFVWYVINTIVVILVIFNIRVYKLQRSKPVPMILKKFVFISRKLFGQIRLHQALSNKNDITTDSGDVPGALMLTHCDKGKDEPDQKGDHSESNGHVAMNSVAWGHVSSAIDKWLLVFIYVLMIIFDICMLQKITFFKPEHTPEDEIHNTTWVYVSGELS